MTHILIIGAGFVGLTVARRLRTQLPDARVTLIDSKDRFLFTPRLIDALEDIDYPTTYLRTDLRLLAKRDDFTFIQGQVTNIDRETKTVFYTPPTSGEHTETLAYDLVVLCHGAKPCFYGIAGIEEYAFALKFEEDVRHIHDRVEHLLTEADAMTCDDMRKDLLTFAAVGGGASGVEAICALKKYVERVCQKKYPALIPHLSWMIVQSGPQILPGFPPSLVRRAQLALERQGVAVRLGAAVTALAPRTLTTTQGIISTGLVLWTAGIQASHIDVTPMIHLDRGGYMPVDASLLIAPSVFGAGDIVLCREGNMVIPKNAQTAMRMADTLTENIIRSLQREDLLPFHHLSKGNIVTVGNTGFLDFKFFVLQTSLTPLIRRLFYRLRFWQMTGL